MTQRSKKSIFAIWSVLKNFAKFYFCDWLLLLLDFYYRLNPDLSSKELIFVRKSSTYFLKLLWRIFNYFLKIKFCKFRKKDILPAVVISVLDLIKTSVQGPLQKQLFAIKYICKKLHCKYWTGFWILLWIVNQVFFFPIIMIDPRTFWIKKRMFSLMSKFFVHIEIITVLKNAGGGRSLKIPRKSDDNHLNGYVC